MHASVCGMLACMCERVLQGHVNLCMQLLIGFGLLPPLTAHLQCGNCAAVRAVSAPSSSSSVSNSGRRQWTGSSSCICQGAPPAAAAAARPLLQRSEEGRRRPRQPCLLRCARLGCSDTRPRTWEGGLEYGTGGGASSYRPNQCGRPFWLWRRFWRQSLKPDSCCSRPVHGHQPWEQHDALQGSRLALPQSKYTLPDYALP